MASCADGTCPPDCAFCARLRRLFPPVQQCPTILDVSKSRRARCRLVRGHRPPCLPSTKRVADTEDTWTT